MTVEADALPIALPGEPVVDQLQARAHGLTPDEYRQILKWLDGRTPTFTELGVFSVMWSEHCSYKSSRKYLKMLPSHGPLVVGGPGENAGAIDIGDGMVAVFKIESHNHPSYVEPYQGAATGVGGILRDIFTMGARPIANMDSLKFGALDHPRTRYLLNGVVAGIGGYGNCVGVPTVAGELMFDPGYNGNILVNAFALGVARREDLQSARARGPGNPVLYVGSATGRDGIHGASLLASAEFDAASESKRPTVQVGDPFTEKLLIEACLEAINSGAIVAIQDMGAAGLSSSSSEMAARGGLGIDLDLDRIPLREPDLTPYEMLLSESQERMLLVAQKGREADIIDIFAKWDLYAVVIGTITETGRWRARFKSQIVADIPVNALGEGAPHYDRPAVPPPSEPSRVRLHPKAEPSPAEALRALLSSPNAGSRRWVYRQYDSLVQSNTVIGPGSDAAILRLKGSQRGLALKVDSNPRACALDPYLGTVAAVCEAARNIACSGARPAAITNCLNYGNPERPEIMWQFIRGVEGLRDAALAFGTPVISGNVSFYNETEGRAIPPTPTIAMVGLFDDVSLYLKQYFKVASDLILMVRTAPPSLAASEYQALFGIEGGALRSIDLPCERRLIDGLFEAATRRLIRSAHDVAEGGMMVALTEACLNPDRLFGAEISTNQTGPADLFGEGTSAVILSASSEALTALRQIFFPLQVQILGQVTNEPRLRIGFGGADGHLIDEDVRDLKRLYEEALPGRLSR
ncbi:MAG TPA: phosphoribosylformylglycinamidine synthase subunit PurL [Candidatus Binataceae bacterium]|nr:phosphoribosylformylglycinamidine synthase subunit PurL [Candidatus Binataceae bacterium]